MKGDFAMGKQLRIELRIGLLLYAAYALLNQFTQAHHFILGMLVGLSICLMLVGGLRGAPYVALKALKKRKQQ